MNIVGASGPGPSWEQPFEMLLACHERVQRMLALLARLRAHVDANGADEQARQAARDVMRYFDLAAPEHHRDEELHIFPAIMAHGDPVLHTLVARLRQDHVAMEAHWAAARAVLDALQAGALPQLAPADHASLEAFAALYGDHIAAEEGRVFPAAEAAVDEAAKAAMSREMAARRGARV
jgi:hemerythrin-like domain-containing protein